MLYQPIVNILPEGFNKFTVPKEVNQSFPAFFTKDAGESDLPLPLLGFHLRKIRIDRSIDGLID